MGIPIDTARHPRTKMQTPPYLATHSCTETSVPNRFALCVALICCTSSLRLFGQPTTHPIGVRVVNDIGEFYKRDTDGKFIPRGNNFIRLSKQTKYEGLRFVYHSMFDVGLYDPGDVEVALSRMHSNAYNITRVFLNPYGRGGIGNPGGGLNRGYMTNLADFLRRAKAQGVFVIVTKDWLPEVGGYNEIMAPYCCAQFEGSNLLHLSPGGVEGNRKFWRDFIRGLKTLDAPLDAIFAYQVRQELSFGSDLPPLNLNSGRVTAANGKTYDMSDQAAKQKMMDEGLVFFIDQVRAAILDEDPSALVTVGFFQPHGPNPTRIGDKRLIRTYPAIVDSKADFIDLHAYPGSELTLQQYVENFEVGTFRRKPIVMGEFGAFRYAFPSAESAARTLQTWQVQSCQYGFSGWLLWSWDVEDQPDVNLWSALSGKGIINQVLAPATRADPCKVGDLVGQNLALNRPATASRSAPSNPASMAVDGLAQTWWSAGVHPPAWIEINLEQPRAVAQIRLRISQWPEGETEHRILARGPGTDYRILQELRGFTLDNVVLEYTPLAPVTGIQFIRIETSRSPSWVSWREIEILSTAEEPLPVVIPRDGAVNGATFGPGFAPGSWIAVFGRNFANSTRMWDPEDFVGSLLPTSLDGLRAYVNGKSAAIYYISPTQLNVQAPEDEAVGPARVEIVRRGQTSGEIISGELRSYAPGFFSYEAGGRRYVAGVHLDGVPVGDPAWAPGTRPAKSGDRILLFGTGFGASPAGRAIEMPIALTSPVIIRIGNRASVVEYSGVVGPGLFQFNVVVPDVPSANHEVSAEIRGVISPSGTQIPVR